MQTPIQIVSQQSGKAGETSTALGERSVSVFRIVFSVALAASALLLVDYLADWSQLKTALHQLGGKPWLVAILLFAYTGAFLLRSVAWRVLTSIGE